MTTFNIDALYLHNVDNSTFTPKALEPKGAKMVDAFGFLSIRLMSSPSIMLHYE